LFTRESPIKAAYAFGLTDRAVSVNAQTVQTNSTTLVFDPSLSTLRIGTQNLQAANLPFNGYIRKLAYYPLRLTNAELQGLTTV